MKNREIDFASEQVIGNLPDYFHPENGDDIPADLVGSEIAFVGTFATRQLVEGGGLVIDCKTAPGEIRRFVFGCNECGLWLVKSVSLQTPANQG